MSAMYETFEHTADLGLRIRSADQDTLFAEAGAALFSAIVEDLRSVRPERRIEVVLPADDIDYLLFDWLKALLYRFDTEHMLFSKFQTHVAADGLRGEAWGETLDRNRHHLEHEVKAITYHGLFVRPNPQGWEAEIIVDI